jgi:hypothetical protein
MSEYKLKPLRLQAVKVERILANSNVPDWVDAALLDGRVIKLPDNTIVALTPQGKRVGTVGDMLIKNMLGELSVSTIANFLAEYEIA